MPETIFVRDLAVVLLVATAAGWILHRIGLSAVVGYLLAGIAIGPFSPAVKLVSDPNHIQLLAQIGLVFLMFSIGLGLSLARLQRMGLSVVVAVVISSILLFNLCRLFGFAMGWNGFQILFLAGTVMISSSSIIMKVLDELNMAHQRAGQLALGITVLEDIVAVVMLTFFVSMMKMGGQGSSIWNTLGAVSAFVIFATVIAMLLVPRLLKVLSRDTSPEPRVVATAGVVLLGAVWALQAGYSLALGAFVLGLVIAGTRYKDELENAFSAVHTIFGAVFFVAVGMMFDFRLLADVWWLVLVVTALILVGRPLACAFGLIGAGHSSRNALQAGLSLAPVGEFAFVLMQVGKEVKVLPEQFYALGIGVSLSTSVIGPLLTRRSEAICSWVEAREPAKLRELIEFYHRRLEALQSRTNASVLWKLSSKRLVHVAMHLLFASALILFSKPFYEIAHTFVGKDGILPTSFEFIYWTVFGLILIGPVIAVWRNLEALGMILAEATTQGSSPLLRVILQRVLTAIGTIVLFGWFFLLVPRGRGVYWILAIAATAVVFYAPLFWRRLLVLHSRFEVEVRQKVKAASTIGATSGLPASVIERPQEWNLQIDEIILPFRSEHAGRRISELAIRKKLGCSIVLIDRQGFLIANPTADEKLFSGDKLLLLGSAEQLAQGDRFLRGTGGNKQTAEFENIAMEAVEVPEGSASAGKSLAELNLIARFGVQICAIERAGKRIPVPSSSEQLRAGDRLLLLGTHESIQKMLQDLSAHP
ncbi:MAG TPA: cation:proton antiporter [Verrucomicrobiae bacterium]|nr:cation:proton antiporter [Verrucomicrobiae bacterium]